MGIVCFLCLPRESVSSETSQSCKKLSILKVLRIPTIWFSFMGFIVATVCNGFLSINLEPQVSKSDNHCMYYTQSLIISTSLIRTDAEILGKFKNRALGSSNLRTTSKNLRTTNAQILKANNQVLLPFLILIIRS